MKELSIEEKAKRYDDAKIRGSQLWESNTITRENYEYIFPELHESEDEKIKKGIKSVLEHYKKSGEVVCPYPFVSIDEATAWLEKQAEKQIFWEKCNHCEYFDGYDICLHKKNFGSVTNESKENCENNKFYFEKQAEKNYEFPPAHEKMETERWKEACKAACCDVNYRSHYGLTETRDDYFVDGVYWADRHPTWKPNDAQMNVLWYLDNDIPLNGFDKRVLHVLIEQLKKLKEK